MRKEIQKQWDIIKKDIHSNPKVKGKEIHHIHGRIGILKCCAYNLAILTKKEHEDYKLLKLLRESTRETIRDVLAGYSKYVGCTKRQGFDCICCLLLNRELAHKGDK